MNIAIVGSREFNDYEYLSQQVVNLIIKNNYDKTPIKIVSGGARGTDKLAEKFAEAHNLDKLVFLAQWSTLGKKAGYMRNKEIVENADALIAFWKDQSAGTKHSIDLAHRKGIPTHVFIVV
jgi:hypothetical protein